MADNTSSWLDWAQSPRDSGGLGLEKHQAAGLVGNLTAESGSGLPSWGPTGDNGSAWGTAQWRNERLDGLKQHAEENGLDYRTPEAQQSWMRHEFDTTRSKAYDALRASTTPEEAATAVNRLYEVSADRSGNRERTARSLYTDGPTAIETAMGRRSTGSQAMGYAPDETQPALRPQVPMGALTAGGSPVDAKPSWLDTLGQTLKDMAPGIAQDPDHAKALEAVAAGSRKAATDQGTWSMQTLPDGTIARMHSKTGLMVDPYGQPITGNHLKPENEKVDPSILKELSTDWTSKYGNLQYAAERAAEFKKAIDNGEIDPSLLGKGKAAWESMWGTTSPQSQKYNDFQAFRTQLANDSLRLNKGVQTEGDAERARMELSTPTGAMDKATLSNALHNFIDRTGKVMNDGATKQLDSYAGNYKNQEPFTPYREQLAKQKKFYEDYARDNAAAESAPAAKTQSFKTPDGVQWRRN